MLTRREAMLIPKKSEAVYNDISKDFLFMTLTETAKATKRFLKIGLTVLSGLIVIWLIYIFVYNNFYVPYKKSQIKPEQKFGTIQKPIFPKSVADSASFEYNLDTQYGGLPTNIPKLMNVYFITPHETTLLAPDRTRKLANSLDFSSDPQILSPSEYRYSDEWGGQMTIELNTGNFSYRRVIPASVKGRPPIQVGYLPAENDLVTDFIGFLNSRALLGDSFKKPRSIISYDNPNRQIAQTAKISLWPDNIGEQPIVTDDPIKGPIYATVTRYGDNDFKYSSLDYVVWSYDPKTFSSYATNSISQAFQDLKNGQGVVIKNTTSANKASITKVYVAYYMSAQYQPYLEPIYVFEGDNFVAYIPALTPESYSK